MENYTDDHMKNRGKHGAQGVRKGYRVFVGSLHSDTSEKELMNILNHYVHVTDLNLAVGVNRYQQ